MADRVQARANQLKSSLFHFSLVKLLIVEELIKLNKEWDYFLYLDNIPLEPKTDTPLSIEMVSPKSLGNKWESVAEKSKWKEVEGSPPSHPAAKNG